jgi:hypothetical protein
MMVILWFQVYTLCRVDRSICIAVSSDMNISMTYIPLITEWSPFFSRPPGLLCWIPALADEARYERESSLSPRECESGEMCVMGWENVWMRWVIT